MSAATGSVDAGRFRPGSTRKNVLLLTLCQALAMTGGNILATTASLVGYSLLADKSWATLPTAVQMAGTMSAIIPASFLMARFGRRTGFTIGALLGAAGALLAATAIFRSSFPLFCLGTALIGSYNGFAGYYRFAAADAADERFKSRAISLVLAGGVAAALFGPEAAKWSRNLFEPILFAGCYGLICSFCLATVVVLQCIAIPPAKTAAHDQAARPLSRIAAQRGFILAAAAGMIAYGAMSLLMTATPVAMLGCGLSFEDTAFVIQWHALGMFAPSFVTGHLIGRFGVGRIMGAGLVLLCLCSAAALSGLSVGHFWAALALLGIAWNFLFIGATTLLTRTYRPAERAKTQAANDFLIFGTVTLSSLSSGVLLSTAGWSVLATLVLPLAAAILVLLLLDRRRRGRLAAAPLIEA